MKIGDIFSLNVEVRPSRWKFIWAKLRGKTLPRRYTEQKFVVTASSSSKEDS